MKNLYKQVKTLILRNKVSDFEYDCVKTEIYQTNLLMLEVCSLVGCVLFFVFFATEEMRNPIKCKKKKKFLHNCKICCTFVPDFENHQPIHIEQVAS